MSTHSQPSSSQTPAQASTLDRSRLRATLQVQGMSFTTLAANVGVSARHLELVIGGKRTMTHAVSEGLQRTVGKDAWAFVTGKSNALKATK